MSNANEPAGAGIFQPPASLEQVAAETSVLLQSAGVQLALAEAGTGGEIARLLRSSSEGNAAITQDRTYDSADALALALRVSPAKVEAFGSVSAMVAAEAAAELIDTYEGGWGLVVMAPSGNRTEGPGVQSVGGQQAECFVALGTPSITVIEQCNRDVVTRTVLGLLARQAVRQTEACVTSTRHGNAFRGTAGRHLRFWEGACQRSRSN